MDTLAPFRGAFRYAAIACSVASAILTCIFGWAQGDWWVISLACALFLVACSLASDYINLFVIDAWRARRWGTAAMLGAGAVFVFSLNLLSNLGSVGWQRDSVIKAATIQQTTYTDRRDQVEEGKASLAMWRERLAKLEAEHAWAPTVTADALRAEAQAEEMRGGCKTKCLAIKARIAIVEEASTLRQQIEATKAVLAKHRAVAADTKTTVAAPESQAKFFASLASMDLAPSAEAQTWTNRGVATLIALGLCIAPVLFSVIGWKTDYRSSTQEDEPRTSAVPTITDITPPKAPDLPRRLSVSTTSIGEHMARMRQLAAV